ncbi:hypothetical protein CLOSTASPAR_06637 [[Clostridium] asparagiforme DSM 15981]|uniref:Uncharacterized protein n=1 Tax=[Clostridium] asparagiforme DSM 15981 TaxID=518636 RepID=C0DBI3_9FIRM|nr:hypothetical protein CLOSTASPAR_06637 [[Clostridium] asparagiforme DSM 15981]
MILPHLPFPPVPQHLWNTLRAVAADFVTIRIFIYYIGIFEELQEVPSHTGGVFAFLCPAYADRTTKNPAGGPGFSGEGISFLMGCSKNYIMYWGGYMYYNSMRFEKSVHKHTFF